MKNKKGDLLNNVLTTVIAIVGLALILFAAWKLYSVYANQENTNAQKLVDSIAGKIDIIEDGQANKFVFSGFESKTGWFLQRWNSGDKIRPDRCYFKSCICICHSPSANYLTGPYLTSPDPHEKVCQETGFCRLFDKNVSITTRDYFEENIPTSRSGATRSVIKTSEIDYLKLPSNLFELQINETREKISIFRDAIG